MNFFGLSKNLTFRRTCIHIWDDKIVSNFRNNHVSLNMSTRRARIKAVVALPPRRKTADNANKQTTSKENQEKPLKSPRTPKTEAGLNDVRNSPRSIIRTPPALLPLTTAPKTPTANKTSSPVRVKTPINTDTHNSSPKPEKVPVITSAAAKRDVFASPIAPSSPVRSQTPKTLLISSIDPGRNADLGAKIFPGCEKDTYIVDDYPPEVPENTSFNTGNQDDIPLLSSNIGSKNEMLKNEVTLGSGELSFVKIRPKLRPIPRLAPHSRSNIQAKSSPDRRRVQSPVVVSPIISCPKTSRHDVATPPPNNEKTIGTPSRNKTNSVSEDYNIPSVPSTTEDVLENIVPLPMPKNSKAVEMLKKEILSDIGDVSFDPIVPLPSPCKVRAKIRPVPRLAPYRRNSVQGSASESEEESHRAQHIAPPPPPPRARHDSQASLSTQQSLPQREANRNRNDSVCSSVSQVTTQPPPATSPVKEKHVISKSRRQEMSRRSWSRRQVKRDALTMYDLIFFNPTTNPIVPDQDELSAKEANAKEEAARLSEPAPPPAAAAAPAPAPAAPVPQIKLGPNGEIILDEHSLVIEQSDSNRVVSSVVREGSWAGAGGGKYTRSARTAEWSAAETVRFYRALGAIGTDFTLMAPLFPGRSRRDLYLKFKKEERLNGGQVDKALRSATSWDVTRLQAEFKEERAAAARQMEQAKQRLLDSKKAERERLKASRDFRVRPSRASKALESSMVPGVGNQILTADDIVQRHLDSKRKPTQKPNREKPVKDRTTTGSSSSNTTTNVPPKRKETDDLATISRLETQWSQNSPICLNEVSGVPKNIETGSLVVLRVSDPSSPSKTMLQTYIAHGSGNLTPVALPATFLNSVVGYMKKGTPKSTISDRSSPQIMSPNSVVSQDSRSGTPSVIQINPSPSKRQRHSSYTITSL